ncbi:MAG TPA: oligosaccharide flippase family protein, partial [Candidatus Cloacimonas sp.]|nr:oligosaccharide flippase family protein [Candidatus Cloacimonas sp.]
MHTKTVISGIRWTLSTTILRRAISLILFIFLAKWLSQTDFGIYRSFSAILALLTYLTHLGLDYLYLVSRQKERVNLLALLQTGLLVSAVITVLLAVFGKNIGAYYHSAELGKVLSYGGGLIFIESLRRIVRVYAQKKFQFKDLALAETLNVIIYSVLCLALIYFWRYAWLFILLFYIGNLGELVYLCIKLPRIPSSLLKRVFSFSWLKKTFALFSHNSNFLLMVNAINLLQSYSINAPILFLGTLVEP